MLREKIRVKRAGQDEPQSPLLAGLNEAQKQAVTAPIAPIIVLAGPGSGKTRVLTSRIGYLISKGATQDSIVAVTFTNKAAKEMKQRIKSLLDIQHDSMLAITVGTFHYVCIRLLRIFGDAIGLDPNFLIFDSNQQKELVKQAMIDLAIDVTKLDPNTIRFAISNLKSQGLFPHEVMKSKSLTRTNRQFFLKVEQVYALYQEELARSSALDFDDILLQAVRLLKSDGQVLERVRSTWRHILVDEWQDTNLPQYELIRLLASSPQSSSVFVVGDTDQSIYGWRGADFSNVNRFRRDFNATQIILEHNYRSTNTIVTSAQAIIEKNKDRIAKNMTSSTRAGSKIFLHESVDDTDEAVYVAKEAKSLVKSGVVPGGFQEIAVMYRTNQQSRVLEEVFVRNGIPYTILGAMRFYERKEIKDILAYLRVIANPNDSASFARIINVPPRGIGTKTIEKVAEYAAKNGISTFHAIQRLDLIESSRGKEDGEDSSERSGAPDEELFTARQKKSLLQFWQVLKTLCDAAKLCTPEEVIETLIDVIEYDVYLQKDEKYDDRWANIQELKKASQRTERVGLEGLHAFLEDVALVAGDEEEFQEEIKLDVDVKKDPRMKLMTIHSSKGLEFEVVFLVGMNDGCLPHSRSLASKDEIEEERRLAYVAITRAKEILYITWPMWKGMFHNNDPLEPSRFLKDIPADFVHVTSDDQEGTLKRIYKGDRKEDQGSKSKSPFGDVPYNNLRKPKGVTRTPASTTGAPRRKPDWNQGTRSGGPGRRFSS